MGNNWSKWLWEWAPIHQGVPQANGWTLGVCFSYISALWQNPNLNSFKGFEEIFDTHVSAVQRWTFLDHQNPRAQMMLSFYLLVPFYCVASIFLRAPALWCKVTYNGPDLDPISSAEMSVCQSLSWFLSKILGTDFELALITAYPWGQQKVMQYKHKV